VASYEVGLHSQVDLVQQLREQIEGLLHIADVHATPRGDAVMFVGRLAHDSDTVYAHLRDRLRPLGYTPVLRRQNGADVVVAQRGVAGALRSNPLVNLVLFALTVFTTLLAGAGIAGVNVLAGLRLAWQAGDWSRLGPMLAEGAPFAITLLSILGVHEMGHYVAARLHGVAVTLPYFIPVPFGLGTFGAFIQLKSPVQDRKALFDVGLAGPLAGLVVAVPMMVIGLLQSEVVCAACAPRLGPSLLFQWLVDLVRPVAEGQAVAYGPVALAAWFGLLVTGFNLLPMGQLDGGHIAYAMLGKRFARPLALVTFLALLGLGYTVWAGWYTWAFFALITGLRHSEPLNDISRLGWGRRVVGLLSVGLFVILLTLRPF
jgi:membrane-associated protease RseP (regulator of RpoE activity)